jgi:hypothetical protein
MVVLAQGLLIGCLTFVGLVKTFFLGVLDTLTDTFCATCAFLIDSLSYILISSFQLHHLVFSSAISLANNCLAVHSGFVTPSTSASSVHNCSTSVCGDLRHSTAADLVISEASFLRSEYCCFNFVNSGHFHASIALSILSLNSCTHLTSAS